MEHRREGEPTEAPERAHDAGAGAPVGGGAEISRRFSAPRKLAAVMRLLRGEPLEVVARDLNVTAAKLSTWRDRALAAGLAAMKERERDEREAEIDRLKAKVGEITMDNELLHEKIARLESRGPLARRRLRR